MIINLDDVTCDRDPPPKEKYAELQANIAARGLLTPLLVSKDMKLIDGWRRLLAMRNLGWIEVAATVTDDFDEALAVVKQANETRPSYRRVFEIYEHLRPMGMERLRRTRSAMNKYGLTAIGAPSPAAGKKIGSWHNDLAIVFNLNSAALQGVITLHRRALYGEPGLEQEICRNMLQEVERGSLLPASALNKVPRLIREAKVAEGSATPEAEEQLALLLRVTASLEGLFRAVDGFEAVPSLGRAERERELHRLRTSRVRLNTLIRKLEARHTDDEQ